MTKAQAAAFAMKIKDAYPFQSGADRYQAINGWLGQRLASPDFDAPATLHRQSQLLQGQDDTFAALVCVVMGKRAPDRVLYSIVIGDTVLTAAEIEEIYQRRDFPP
jgi:hypothetical protein